MNKLEKILHDSSIPKNIKRMVNSLSSEGKEALNSMFDKESNFYTHAHPTNIAKRFWADPHDFPTLYHYTDINGLKGILSSKKVRIGSQYYMNDPEENIYTIDLARQYLVDNNVSNEVVNFFIKDFTRLIFDAYIWSFTNNDHSESLLAYGDFAIEFDNQEVQEAMVEKINPGINSFEQMENGNSYIFPLRVEYNEEVQKEYISVIMSTYLKAYKNLKIDQPDMYEIMNNCYRALSIFALCFKNPLLYQEEEIRFVAVRKHNDNLLHPDKVINNKPYIIFPLDQSLIKKIIYSRNVKDISAIKNVLKINDFDASLLEKTKLPYGRKE